MKTENENIVRNIFLSKPAKRTLTPSFLRQYMKFDKRQTAFTAASTDTIATESAPRRSSGSIISGFSSTRIIVKSFENTKRSCEIIILPYMVKANVMPTLADSINISILLFAISAAVREAAKILPAFSAAILFNMDASSGGTDIIAMIIKRFASVDIGVALMITDALVAVSSFFVYGPETGLFSVAGLLAKTLVIDGVIENFNLCKFFTIISENPEPIVKFIHEDLNRSATVYRAEGTYLHKDKTVILAVTKRRQAVMLRNFVKVTEPGAFLMITNSSEIIGKGFQGY